MGKKSFAGYLIAVYLFDASFPRLVRAEMDGQQLAQGATSLASIGMMMAMTDSLGSASDCICKAATSGANCGTTMGPWQDCAMLALNVAAIAGTAASMFMNQSAADAQKATGSGSTDVPDSDDPTVNPFTGLTTPPPGMRPLTLTFCQKNPGSPKCLNNLKNDLDTRLSEYKSGLLDGSIPPPEGQTPQGAIAALEDALAGKGGSGPTPGEFQEGAPNAVANRDAVNAGMSFDAGPEGGFAKRSASNSPKSPIKGNLVIKNGLERVDSETGEALSLWQLATLRYHGKDKSRYMGLARIEYLRRRAQNIATQATLPLSAPRAQKTPEKEKSIRPTRLPLN